MSFHVHAHRNRTIEFDLTIKQDDGTNVTLGAGDVLRLKLGRKGQAPLLDLDTSGASAGGSTMTFANPTRVVLDQDDVDITPGAYDFELNVVDASDANRIKHAETGVLTISDMLLGDIGFT